jgi:ABC-type cobalamin/Fe3+-siderophores transport system ATPase subunit
VVAIAGENGSGKSTVLKAAAAAYRPPDQRGGIALQDYSPDDFFPSTPWETVSGVRLEYRVRLGDLVATHSLRKATSRWRGMPERPRRRLYFLDISRTQPVDTLIGYGKVVRVELAATAPEMVLTDNYRSILSRVLGRTYDTGSLVRDARGKQVGIVEHGGNRYSNFHQGAGEDATTDLVALLQEVPNHSLVLIDEVEASLHPRAQRRLMTELIKLAGDKRLQLVVSTHSPYVLEQLPPGGAHLSPGDARRPS